MFEFFFFFFLFSFLLSQNDFKAWSIKEREREEGWRKNGVFVERNSISRIFFRNMGQILGFYRSKVVGRKMAGKMSFNSRESFVDKFISIEHLIYKIYRKDFLSKTMNEIDDEILFISQFVLFFLIDAIVENNRNLHIFKPIILISKLEIAF